MKRKQQKQLIIICGPTATGKTGLGIKFCQKFNGEIISADSRQIYKYMDIGTGKDMGKNSKFKAKNEKLQSKIKKGEKQKFNLGYYLLQKTPIWLYDVVEPNYNFNVSDFVVCAETVLASIQKRQKIPFLVGGTGFYIKAITKGIETIRISPDWRLRKKLEELTTKQLLDRLKRIDPSRYKKMSQSDKKNKRRLIRAIEIANSKLKTQNSKLQLKTEKLKNNILKIGLMAPRDYLYEKIDKRIDKMIEEGLIEEIKGLLKKSYSWNLSSMFGIGYRQFNPFFEKEKTLDECVQQLKWDTHAYVRRQETWFKKDKKIKWFDVSNKNFEINIESKIKKFLDSN